MVCEIIHSLAVPEVRPSAILTAGVMSSWHDGDLRDYRLQFHLSP